MPMERRTERLLGCARDGLNQPAAVADRRVATRKKLPLAAFADLGLIEPILSSIRAEKYTAPTPIQVQAIPALLEGRDLLGCAQTGTGKTAAFASPIL
jgi:superfamily II DNA/RNA helicase